MEITNEANHQGGETMLQVNTKAFIIARAKACLTTDELSKLSGVGRTTISRIENNKANINASSIGKLARALNVSVESLLDEN